MHATEAPPPPANSPVPRPGGWRRLAHAAKRLLLYCFALALVLSVVLVLSWQAIQQSVLRQSCADLPQLTHGVASCRDVGGHLPGVLTIGEVLIQLPQQRISLREITIRPHLSWLLARRLSASFLTVDTVDIHQLVHTGRPMQLPPRMLLPFGIDVDTVSIRSLRYHSPVNDLRFSQGVFHHVRLDPRLWQTDDFRFQTQQFQISGRAHLVPLQPYATTGHYRVLGAYRGQMLDLTMDGSGDLGGLIETGGHGQLGAAAIVVNAGIFATHRQLFPHVDIAASQLSLRDWLPKAPDVLLQGELHALSDAQGFHGVVSASNLRPGPLNKQRLPARQGRADWQWQVGAARRLVLQNMHVQFDNAAHIDGELSWDGGLQIKAGASAVNLAAWYPRLQTTHLSGPLSVQTTNYRDYAVEAALSEGHDRLAVQGNINRQGAEATRLEFARGDSKVNGSGKIEFGEQRHFELAAELHNANPALFAQLPAGRLNGKVHALGSLRPLLDLAIDTSLVNSQWLGSALSLDGRGHFRQPDQIKIDALHFSLGQLSGSANGSLGAEEERMNISATLSGAQSWLPGLSSHAQIDGQLQGRWRQPIFTGQLRADDLSYQQWAVHALQINISSTAALSNWLNAGGDFRQQLPPLTASVSAKSLAYQQREVDDLQFNYVADGDGKSHITLATGTILGAPLALTRVSMDFAGALGDNQITLAASQAREQLQTRWQGALDLKNLSWHGSLEQLTGSGALAVSLDQAVPVAWTPTTLDIGATHLHAGLMAADISNIHIDREHWSSSGQLEHIDIRQLLALLGKPAPETTLALSAAWTLNFHDSLNGDIKIFREGGQWIDDDNLDALRLQGGQLLINVADNHLTGDLQVRSRSAGNINGKFSTTLSIVDGRPGILGSTPINGSLTLDAPSLSWLGLWMAVPGYEINGQANGHVEITGSIADPHLQGALQGRNISFAAAASGIKWHNGSVDAQIENQQLVVTQVSWSGESGSVSGKGLLSLHENNPDVFVELNADKLQIFDRPDQKLILSGKGRASLQNQRLALDADLRVDRGLITLRSANSATLDDDVKLPASKRSKPVEGKHIGLYINASLNLGDNFQVKNRSFNAQATGLLRLNSTPQTTPALNGNIVITQGSLNAYGQNLKVRADTSSLNFVGPFDNPGLNIYAYKYNENQPTDPKTGNKLDVGVHISGNAQRPVVNLISDPVGLSDSQKLSWLLFGQDISAESTTRQNSVLGAAAAALASSLGDGSSQSLPQMIGLDQVSVERPTDTTDLSQGLVRLGKQLAPNLYLSFGKGYNGAADDVLINYIINKKWSIELRGSRNSSVDMFYTIPFD